MLYVGWWWREVRRWYPVLAHSLLLLISTNPGLPSKVWIAINSIICLLNICSVRNVVYFWFMHLLGRPLCMGDVYLYLCTERCEVRVTVIIRVFCSRASLSLQTHAIRLHFCSKEGLPSQTQEPWLHFYCREFLVLSRVALMLSRGSWKRLKRLWPIRQ